MIGARRRRKKRSEVKGVLDPISPMATGAVNFASSLRRASELAALEPDQHEGEEPADLDRPLRYALDTRR